MDDEQLDSDMMRIPLSSLEQIRTLPFEDMKQSIFAAKEELALLYDICQRLISNQPSKVISTLKTIARPSRDHIPLIQQFQENYIVKLNVILIRFFY